MYSYAYGNFTMPPCEKYVSSFSSRKQFLEAPLILNSFENRFAIVTGGTRGIGQAVSLALLAGGADVTAIYGSSDESAKAFIDENEGGTGRLAVAKVDVSDYEAVEKFYSTYEKEHERLDILVAGAGIRRDGIVGMMPKADWDGVININLTGTFNMAKFAVRLMMKNRFGRIIAVSSPMSHFGFAGQANYSASKAGQVALIKSLSKEVAKRGITANCVSPGFVDTDFIGELPEDQKKAYIASVPVKRFGRPEEVAELIAFIASEKAAYINGADIEITGGL